jgi:hypothetical protein
MDFEQVRKHGGGFGSQALQRIRVHGQAGKVTFDRIPDLGFGVVLGPDRPNCHVSLLIGNMAAPDELDNYGQLRGNRSALQTIPAGQRQVANPNLS